MDNSVKINKLSKQYFVVFDGKPVCPPVEDEPGVFDAKVVPLFKVARLYGDNVHIVCVTTFDVDDENTQQS